MVRDEEATLMDFQESLAYGLVVVGGWGSSKAYIGSVVRVEPPMLSGRRARSRTYHRGTEC